MNDSDAFSAHKAIRALDAKLQIPPCVPIDFAQFLRRKVKGSHCLTALYNSTLNATPDNLWLTADDATTGIDNRTEALCELFGILISASGLAPTQTVKAKRNAQRDIAKKVGDLRVKCQADLFPSQADLRAVLEASATGGNENESYAASVATLLYKIGAADTGIKLPELLAGLEKAMYESADSLDHLWDGPQPLTVRRNEKGKLAVYQRPINKIDYQLPLYGPGEGAYDSDFPAKKPPKPQQNHSQVATRLVRWFQTYTGKPHALLVRKTVDARLGHRDPDTDHENYVAQAIRRASD